MNGYLATAERHGAWWALEVPALPGVHTQARRLDRAEYMVRDAIALFLDVDPDSFDVVVQPELSGHVGEAVRRTREARMQADEMSKSASELMRATVAELARRGMTTRDIGTILGISHQRVAQLAVTNTGSPPPVGPTRQAASTS